MIRMVLFASVTGYFAIYYWWITLTVLVPIVLWAVCGERDNHA